MRLEIHGETVWIVGINDSGKASGISSDPAKLGSKPGLGMTKSYDLWGPFENKEAR